MKRATVNQRANQKMKQYCVDHGITRCELKLRGCTGSWGLSFAHRHKRRYYYSMPVETLWDRSEWRLACINCHEQIEYDSELTEKIWTA